MDSDYARDLDKARSITGYGLLVAGTDELVLYSIVYCGFVNDRSRVYGFNRSCEGSNVASGLDG